MPLRQRPLKRKLIKTGLGKFRRQEPRPIKLGTKLRLKLKSSEMLLKKELRRSKRQLKRPNSNLMRQSIKQNLIDSLLLLLSKMLRMLKPLIGLKRDSKLMPRELMQRTERERPRREREEPKRLPNKLKLRPELRRKELQPKKLRRSSLPSKQETMRSLLQLLRLLDRTL